MSNAQFMTIWGQMKTKAVVDITSNVSYKISDLIGSVVSLVSINSVVKVYGKIYGPMKIQNRGLSMADSLWKAAKCVTENLGDTIQKISLDGCKETY